MDGAAVSHLRGVADGRSGLHDIDIDHVAALSDRQQRGLAGLRRELFEVAVNALEKGVAFGDVVGEIEQAARRIVAVAFARFVEVARLEERRVGKEWVSECRYRWRARQ